MGHLDIKAAAIYIGAIFLGDVNQALQAAGLIANLAYLIYQFKVFKKKNKESD